MNVYLGLIHYPVRNKNGQTITSAVTNLDIHDIARSCRTYGIKKYFIITPVKAQHELLDRILGHWKEDKNLAYNPDRSDALALVSRKNSWGEALTEISHREAQSPLVAVTGAHLPNSDGGCQELVRQLSVDKRPLFILFGTGWGLQTEIIVSADFRLTPLSGQSQDGYNHLSVRSAVAIYLDRLATAGHLSTIGLKKRSW